MEGFARDVLARLPLAEAVLRLCQWQSDAQTLNDLFEAHRGLGYTKELTFATLVALIGAAQCAEVPGPVALVDDRRRVSEPHEQQVEHQSPRTPIPDCQLLAA